jgi:hypothetical protein
MYLPDLLSPGVRSLNASLEAQGWSELHRERRGADLVIEADALGQPARILALSPFVTSSDVHDAVVDPSFLRLDLGDPDGAPLRWAVWTRSATLPVFEGGPVNSSFLIQAIESAVGRSIAVHGHLNISQGASVLAPRVLFEVLTELTEEARVRTARGSTHSLDPDRPLSSALTVQKKDPGINLLAAGALGLSFVSLAAGAAIAFAGLVDAGLVVAAAGSTSAIPYVVAARQRGKDPGRFLDKTLVDTLRSSDLFDEAKVVGEGRPMPVPAVTASPGGREAQAGVLRSSLIKASSSQRALKAEVSRWTIHWPPNTMSECQLVPSSWVVCELSGDETALIQAPDWNRQSRSHADLRWLLSGDEVARGDLDDLLVVLARRTMDQQKAPYR